MWHHRGSPHAIQTDTMVLVRAVMPVRGVVHVQTANRFGWRARNPSPTGPMWHRAGYERLNVAMWHRAGCGASKLHNNDAGSLSVLLFGQSEAKT